MSHGLGILNITKTSICCRFYPQYLGDVQLGHLPTPAKNGWSPQILTLKTLRKGKWRETAAFWWYLLVRQPPFSHHDSHKLEKKTVL